MVTHAEAYQHECFCTSQFCTSQFCTSYRRLTPLCTVIYRVAAAPATCAACQFHAFPHLAAGTVWCPPLCCVWTSGCAACSAPGRSRRSWRGPTRPAGCCCVGGEGVGVRRLQETDGRREGEQCLGGYQLRRAAAQHKSITPGCGDSVRQRGKDFWSRILLQSERPTLA